MGSFKKYNLNSVSGILHVMPFKFPGVKDTGETVSVRSLHSAEFREANAEAARQRSVLRTGNDGDLDDQSAQDIHDRAFAALVAEWTFDEECNVDNIVQFLRDNPHFRDEVNITVTDDSLFFKNAENS